MRHLFNFINQDTVIKLSRTYPLAMLFIFMLFYSPINCLAQNDTIRVMMIGAHPDDCDQKAGGIAALFASMGHSVKFLSVTNGDAGHYSQGGGVLAKRRAAERFRPNGQSSSCCGAGSRGSGDSPASGRSDRARATGGRRRWRSRRLARENPRVACGDGRWHLEVG